MGKEFRKRIKILVPLPKESARKIICLKVIELNDRIGQCMDSENVEMRLRIY